MEATLGELVDAIIAVDGWEPTDGNRAGLGALCRFMWGLDVVTEADLPDGVTPLGVGSRTLAVWEYADEVEAAQAFHDLLELPPYGPVRALAKGGRATGPELVAAFNATRFGWCPPELAEATIDFSLTVPTDDPFPPDEEELESDVAVPSLGELEAIAEAAKAVGATTLAGIAAALHELAARIELIIPADEDEDADTEPEAPAAKSAPKTPKR